MSMFGISNVEASSLVRLSHADPTGDAWRPYITALEKAIDWDDQQYPAGILNTLLLLNEGKDPF